ncbi:MULTISPECIES: HAD family hydrolase [unclassified Streptomyces]|uniref:HAD family hydrolase n=1 Tax=unclassified Streptomyces TaxID=2593676 RepID=UPI0022592C29|nr:MULTISPECIES: HAD family hydrolase [unclassified Streptomyces]MCX5049761.1 HAD family hydrolase [Streptomyces sp. NBC_00474]MCX5055502.1 HAD family hydrolase [Streptomyces sp. NBC_00452]
MTNRLHTLRLAAVNIDGVLLNDTFSPLIHRFVTRRGGVYSADVERRVFSQRQADAGRAMAAAVPQALTGEEALAAYFEERAAYLADHPVEVTEGTGALLRRLRAAGLDVVCYGGLAKSHFDEHLGAYAGLFTPPSYICTNDVRPGLREITAHFGLEHGQVLFIDDVARVAEAARALGAPFIGRPSRFEHSHQAELMRQAGARHLVDGLDEIDDTLLRTVDEEATEGTLWPTGADEPVPTAR